MRAVEVVDGVARLGTAPDPVCGPGEVVIEVHAAGLNRADLMQLAGRYPPPPGASPTLGLECAGRVVEVGEGADWHVGDPVCALLSGGGYAEQVVVPAGHVLPVPRNLDTVAAAALPEVFTTAWLNLYGEAGLVRDECVVLHAGASGVGTAAIQLLRESGNPCFVTAGSAEKIQRCMELGADGGHDRHQGSFVEAVQAWAPDGVDVILDPVGQDYIADDLRVLGTRGRIVLIGLLSGRTANVDLGRMLVKRLRLMGSVLRARSIAEKDDIIAGMRQTVWPLFDEGRIQPLVDATFPVDQVAKAHELLRSNQTFGKVLLTF